MTNDETTLAVKLRENELGEHDAAMLESTFEPFFKQAQEWRAKAQEITVTDADDKAGMKAAREARLALKNIRVEVEKRRKELKEESLRKGKAIDGVANVIKFLIEPIEEHLQKQEDFVKVQEEQRKQALKAEREAELLELEVDVSFYNLADMPEEQYAALLKMSQTALADKKQAAELAEQARIEREKKEAEERERIRVENERLRKEAEEREKALEAERKERERIEAEARAKAEAEATAKREAEEKAKQEQLAPDREKLARLAERIVAVEMPDVTSQEAKAVIQKAVKMLADASEFVKLRSIKLQ